MISIIIPVYNEESMLSRASGNLQKLLFKAELIFVDGGSSDQSFDITGRLGKALCSKKGRAIQMNHGASCAKGDILLFLHADNIISPAALDSIEKKIASDNCVGGCFTQKIDNDAFIYRLIEWQGNIRALMTKEFYGDQGIFVKKEAFLKIGGFPEMPIMEDIFFTKKLRKYGKTAVLPDKILVSARRWEKAGVFKTSLLFSLIVLLFRLKVPLNKIKQLYADLR
ncbi:MAG: TIGR04283 family arsenosugar biosynthesis glycosyltransferase [Candidatus Omnitrophica bacterium]|nr:TIGR04283 family arsenosugar biosynthesis glycosyltransferase [Candidatus Omnitrophota bacterium]